VWCDARSNRISCPPSPHAAKPAAFDTTDHVRADPTLAHVTAKPAGWTERPGRKLQASINRLLQLQT
jgi:hypothetical protein